MLFSFHPQFVCLKKDLKVSLGLPPSLPLFKPMLTLSPSRKCHHLLVIVFFCPQGLVYLDTDGFLSNRGVTRREEDFDMVGH